MNTYDGLLASLEVSPQLAWQVSQRFAGAMAGNPDHCGLKMLDSQFQPPCGREQGEALALDFGGTNLRFLLIRVNNRSFQVLKQKVVSIRPEHGGWNLASEAVDGEQLFDFIAAQLQEFADPGTPYQLGHCFSFPFMQISRNSGLLLEWTKEIKTRGVVGQDVSLMLSQALQRRGLDHIQPVAILNDTVATLLCAAYLDNDADVGSICGTGFNACFRDLSGRIINIEAGNFFADILPVNRYDLELDRRSHNQGQQRLEKMVSGAYLGELFRLMLLDRHLWPSISQRFASPNSLDSRWISGLLSGEESLLAAWGVDPDSAEQKRLLNLAQAVVVRSARLIAAVYTGIIQHIDPHWECRHVISVDGSLYERMPLFADHIRNTIDEIASDRAYRAEIRFIKDSSGLGAALAALMEARQ